MTKRSARADLAVTPSPLGSGVRAKSRFRRYSESFRFGADAMNRTLRGLLAARWLLLAGGGRLPGGADGALLLRLALFEAFPQPGHQVDDSGVLRLALRLLELDLLTLHLRLDDPQEIGAVVIGVLRRIKRLGEIRDELLGHLHLLGPNRLGAREAELADVDQLVGEAHDLEHDGIADHFDTGEVLSLAHDDLADADRPRLADGFAQQRVRLLAALGGEEEVRGLEEARIDLVFLHEVDDVDDLRRLEGGRLEVLVGHHDELALGVLVSLDDLAPGNRLSVGGADALVLDRREVFFVEHPEAEVVRSDSAAKLDRNAHESEGDRTFPDSRHRCRSMCSGVEISQGLRASEQGRCRVWKDSFVMMIPRRVWAGMENDPGVSGVVLPCAVRRDQAF